MNLSMISVQSLLAVVVMFWSGWLVQVADASTRASQHSEASREAQKPPAEKVPPGLAEFLRFGARAFDELDLKFSRPLTAADKVRLTEFFSMHADALWEVVGGDLEAFFKILWTSRPDKAPEERVSGTRRGKGHFRRSDGGNGGKGGNSGKAGNDDY